MKKIFLFMLLTCLSICCFAQHGFKSEAEVYNYLTGKTFKFNASESNCDANMKIAFGTTTFFYKNGKFYTTLNGKTQGGLVIEKFYGLENNGNEAWFAAYSPEDAAERAENLGLWQSLFIGIYKQYGIVTISFAGDHETLLVYKLQKTARRR